MALMQAIPVSLHTIPVSLHIHSTLVSQTVHHVACSYLVCLSLRPHGFSYLLLQNANEGHSTTENTGLKKLSNRFFYKVDKCGAGMAQGW